MDLHPTVLHGGLVSQVYRIELVYEEATYEAPRSLIAKFGPNDARFNEQFCQREPHFYQHFASDTSMPTPLCYHSEASSEENRVILLLADVGSTKQTTWETALTQEQAEVAVAALARMHALWWDDKRLGQMHWLMRRNLATWNDDFADRWRELEPPERNALADPIVRICERLASKGTAVFLRWSAGPQTLLHGDYHLHNTLFEADQRTKLRAVVDWSNVGVGPGGSDLSFFLTHSLQSHSRRSQEEELVHSYHDILVANGVTGYDAVTCWDDYRLWTLNYGLLWATIPVAGRSHLPFWGLVMDRLAEAIVDQQAAVQ